MTLLADLAEWSLAAFALLLFAVQFIARELGHWIGRRQRAKVEGRVEGVGVIVGGMLGLLAFVLALTLSFANGRFAERRAGSLVEVNAIGTAWLRAEAIQDPRGKEIAQLLEDYTRLRIEFVQAGRDQSVLDQLNQRTNAMQSKIWGYLAGIVRDQPNTVSTALQASLNDVFDAATSERFAFAFRMPARLFWLLIGLTLLTMAALGYQLGLSGKPMRTLVVLLIAMWTLVIV
ncbi:MAG: hypothetical protein ACREF3_11185, partial [Acetobacteraceae bacterium]